MPDSTPATLERRPSADGALSAQTPRPARRIGARARLALVVVVVVAILAAVVPMIASGGEDGPATGAAAVVPADALAYVHVSTDRSRAAVRQALALAHHFPDHATLSASLLARLAAIGGGSGSVDFGRDIGPWLGQEAALAVLNTASATAGTLIVLDVANRARAQAFLGRSGATYAGSYRGVRLLRYPSGTELAFVSHYLTFGQDASVRAAIDVRAGAAGSLAANPTYVRAAAGEPANRVLDAYASQAGIRRLLEPRGGVVGALGVLLDKPALAGVAASLSPAPGGARVHVHSVLDPSLANLSGAPVTAFTPTLQNVLPAGSALLLDVRGLDKLAPRILAAGAAAGIAGQIGPLLRRLGTALSAEGVNVGQILSLFAGETAVGIVPAASSPGPPALVIVARTRDQAGASAMLASLEGPLAQLFAAPASGPGQAPTFNDRVLAGVTVHQVSLAPGLRLDYAVFHGLVVISTSAAGIAAVAQNSRPLGHAPAFAAALGARPQKTGSLLFLDFSQLLSLGEQTGLLRSARFYALAPDLQRIRTIGLESTSGEADTTAELFLQIP